MTRVSFPPLTVKACVFDAYGTLLDVAAAARRCERALGGKAAALTEVWRMKQLQYTWLRSLMGEYVPFDTVTAEALDYALAAVGLGDKSGRLRRRLMAIYRELDAYPDAKPALRAPGREANPDPNDSVGPAAGWTHSS